MSSHDLLIDNALHCARVALDNARNEIDIAEHRIGVLLLAYGELAERVSDMIDDMNWNGGSCLHHIGGIETALRKVDAAAKSGAPQELSARSGSGSTTPAPPPREEQS